MIGFFYFILNYNVENCCLYKERNMNIKPDKKLVTEIQSDLIVLGLFSDCNSKCENFSKVNEALDNAIEDYVLKKEAFKPEFLASYVLPTLGKIKTPKILIIGLGESEKLDTDKLRQAAMEAAKKINSFKNISSAAIAFPLTDMPQSGLQAISEGLILGGYKFDKYKSQKKEKSEIKNITISCTKCDASAKKGILKGEIFAKAANFARNLSNEPAQFATPSKLAEIAQNLPDITTEVFDKKACEKMGMGAFLAVGRGSDQPPKFIHMTYKPKKANKKIAIIGKGITFDSGGYDIKPPSSMLNMKDDMSAAAGVLAIMSALPELAPEIEVHGIIAACENMLSGNSYKPGDILTAKNGKTIEVDNTDAEGRLTLADALCFAEELNVDEIIDVATLTGACLVALGHFASGIMGNDENLIEKILKSSEKSGEAFWKLPIWDAHMESLKSDIADFKNTGSRYAGASVAGAFLKNFVKDTPWAHLDVAGTAFLETPYKGFIKGGTGIAVRTLLEFITEND